MNNVVSIMTLYSIHDTNFIKYSIRGAVQRSLIRLLMGNTDLQVRSNVILNNF